MGKEEEEEAEEEEAEEEEAEEEEEEEENEGLFLRQKWDRTVSFTEPFAASKPDLVSIDHPPLLEALDVSFVGERRGRRVVEGTGGEKKSSREVFTGGVEG